MKRSEIGSEFWDAFVSERENTIFANDVKWFLSGRVALRYILEDISEKGGIKTVALPSWCCDSMIIPFIDMGIDVSFYSVYVENGMLKQDIRQCFNCDALLVMDYFGYVGFIDCSEFHGIVIRDVTHSVFSNAYTDADYYFGSARKWSGLWTGGFAWSKDKWVAKKYVLEIDYEYIDLREQAMKEKAKYIDGCSNSKEYLLRFARAEEILDSKSKVQDAADRDIYCARHLDVENMKAKRRQNAKALLEHLSNVAIFPTVKDNDCPLFVPILVPNGKRNELRKFLIQNEVFCPVHWPVTEYHQLDDKTKKLYDEELSIVCDQRYNINDMNRICQLIAIFMGE